MSDDQTRAPIPAIVWIFAAILFAGLAAIFLPGRVIGHTIDAKRAKAASDIAEIRNALNRFRLACDRFPTTAEGLDALLAGPKIKGWMGPYMPSLGFDPWQNPYQYLDLGGDNYRVTSMGPDGAPGGGDDVGVP